MKNYIKIMFFIGFVLCASGVWADVVGKAEVGAYGIFPAKGNYCSTNAFQNDSVIAITNMDNGKVVEVYVLSSLDGKNVAFLLSADAGKELDITLGNSVNVIGTLLKNYKSAVKTAESPAALLASKTGSSKKVYPVLPGGQVYTELSVPIEPEAPEPINFSDDEVKKTAEQTSGLPSGGYIQLGVFRNKESAQNYLSSIYTQYPLAVEQEDGNSGFKVLAGPFELDELDSILVEFRNSGYPDAFRKIK